MQVVNLSSVRPDPDSNERQFERLVAALSSRFASANLIDLETAMTGTLIQICQALDVDRAMLIEFDGARGIRSCYSQALASATPDTAEVNAGEWLWLLTRLHAEGMVAVSRFEDLPADAGAERDFARRGSLHSILAVAITIGGDCVGALVLGSRQRFRDWQPVQDRARLIAEIIGGAQLRSRQEAALRLSLAEIERLNSRLAAENVVLKDDIKTFHDFEEIVGESEVMRTALDRLSQVAPLHCSVLLLGETGTGKELFARALHDRSSRRSRALIRVNCAALPPTLVESELFGHERGAFTGAVTLRQGRFELADGGTIFLDEIGDLPLESQGKILRVLQEGEFERVGSSRTRRVDVRVIAATHHNLEELVADGRFRADLFYRLSVYPIPVPALRERREDIASLTWFFVHRRQRELGRRITRIPDDVMATLEGHDWPGNVRELENVIERAMIRSHGDVLQLDGSFAGKGRVLLPATGTLDDIQRAHIENTLRKCGWRINGRGNAAERLGLHPNTLRFRMKKLGIPSSREQQRAGARA